MAYKDKLPILKNFVEMGITQDVSSVDTTIYVSNASLFPAVVPGADYIPCVIRWSGSTREVVHVTAVNTSANTITVERGQEGTAAQSWPIGSFIYATLTAQAQADLLNNIWIRCRQSDGNAVAITVESATSFSLPGDWRDSLEPMMALRILANGAFLSTENGIYIDLVSYTASTGKTLVGIRGATLPATVAAVEHSLSSRAVSQSKEVQAYRDLVERVSANLNESERICTEKAQIAQAAADRLTLSSAVDSTKEDCAATPFAVKKAYDRGSAGIAAAETAQAASTTAKNTANNALNVANTKQPNLGFTPIQQGGGTGQGNNKIYIGWATDASGLKAQADSTYLGNIVTTAGGTIKAPQAALADRAQVANTSETLFVRGWGNTKWGSTPYGQSPLYVWCLPTGGADMVPCSPSVLSAGAANWCTYTPNVRVGHNGSVLPAGGTWRIMTSRNGEGTIMDLAGGSAVNTAGGVFMAIRVA